VTAHAFVVDLHVLPPGDPAPEPIERLHLDRGDPVGDRHHGLTMPWYTRQRRKHPRGPQIRNNPQPSVVDVGGLPAIAQKLGLAKLAPGALADNICLSGVDELTAPTPMSRPLFCDDDPVVVTDGENPPSTVAGAPVRGRYATAPESFPKAAMHLRGVTGGVERPGVLTVRMPVRVVPTRTTG